MSSSGEPIKYYYDTQMSQSQMSEENNNNNNNNNNILLAATSNVLSDINESDLFNFSNTGSNKNSQGSHGNNQMITEDGNTDELDEYYLNQAYGNVDDDTTLENNNNNINNNNNNINNNMNQREGYY
jgi:hypothetical protein